MNKVLCILCMSILFLYSCQSNSQSKHVDLNGLKIDSELVSNISELTKKSLEKNSVIRYKPTDSTNIVFERYDSLVPGIKFKFIDEMTAYKVIDQYFDKVKESNNYLYLTNLDFDDSFNSHYDIVIAPISNQLELIKFVRTEPVNYDLSNEDVVEWFRKKQNELDYKIIVADLDRIEAIIISKPKSFKKLGKEIYKFCPDVIDQGHSDMNELVKYLETKKHMWFWWD